VNLAVCGKVKCDGFGCSRELVYGIPVFTEDGERIGMSTRAATKAITQVVVSRVFMATPGMSKFCHIVTFVNLL